MSIQKGYNNRGLIYGTLHHLRFVFCFVLFFYQMEIRKGIVLDEANVHSRRGVDSAAGWPRRRQRLRGGRFERFVDLGFARFRR